MKINISKLNKAEVLTALYNNAKPLGMGFLQHEPGDMNIEEAQQLLKKSTYFDYVKGKLLKVDLSKDELDTFLYNRDNGDNAAENSLAKINMELKKLNSKESTQ